ncbi:MAG: DUF4350 domain-containing protein [Hydrococcus sp. C42_A2020_068]|nr:DUF4350 domain-containing protein [Hydrococcus sp. C42_A2020_068]
MIKLSRRRLIILSAIALLAVIVITLVAAPSTTKLNSGSTYGRAPDGYGAWYAFMSERGTPVQRWQKSFEQLLTDKTQQDSSGTFLRIYPQLTPEEFLWSGEHEWVEKGNTLVIVGISQPATEASFSTEQDSSSGKVKIDTSRRNKNPSEKLLGDRFGAVVWAEKIGKGRVIYCVTPHLAANAYQDFRSNYEFLARLVTQGGNSVWVDEYLHGYKDKEVIAREIGENLFSYLAKTPLLPLLIQAAIATIIAIWSGNRRFGKPTQLSTPTTENSKAYIEALAGVLQKAKSSEFLVLTIAKEERRQLQKALGLEDKPLESQVIVDAWVQQTGRSPADLESLLNASSRKSAMTEGDLLAWMEKWQNIRQSFDK